MMDPSKTLDKPCRLLALFGVLGDDDMFKGCRLWILIGIMYLQTSTCYIWSFVRHFKQYGSVINAMYVVAIIQAITKLVELKVKKEKLAKLMISLNAQNFDMFPSKHVALYEKSLSQVNKITQSFFILMQSSVSAVIVSWFLQNPSNGSGKRTLLLDTWLPYNYERSPVYESTIIFQIVILVFTAETLLATDLLLFGLVHWLATQLDILNVELGALVRNDKDCSHLLRRIKLCVVYHQHIKENFKLLNSIAQTFFFSEIVFIQMLVCLSLFNMQKSESYSFDQFKNMALITCVIAQFYIYCYFGQTVINKSDNLSKSVYFSNWYEYECRCPKLSKNERLMHERLVRKSFIIIMCGVQKPIEIDAGKIMTLKYETFMKILKAGYSYYTVFVGK